MTMLILGVMTVFVILLGAATLIIANEYGASQKMVTLWLWAILLWAIMCKIIIDII
jgi:hypothetical protein